jgi:hypothetical protein
MLQSQPIEGGLVMPWGCSHKGAAGFQQVCLHLIESSENLSYSKGFTGEGRKYVLLCSECAEHFPKPNQPLRKICDTCFAALETQHYWSEVTGRPEVLQEPSQLFLEHRLVQFNGISSNKLLNLQPLTDQTRSCWLALSSLGDLLRLDFEAASATTVAHLPSSEIELTAQLDLQVTPDGKFVAVANTGGNHGVVLNLVSGQQTMRLKRDGYHSNVSPFPLAFFSSNGKSLLIHGTEWNRLDISDPATGTLLTPRKTLTYHSSKQPPPHYLDYFHGRLAVSPNSEWVADDGWVWHPVGSLTSWRLSRWLSENPWESEDGPSKRELCWRYYFWGGPFCWVGDQTLAIWGYGNDDDSLIPAVRLIDVETGKELSWFAGVEIAENPEKNWTMKLINPMGWLSVDRYLFACSEQSGFSVWNVERGTRLMQDQSFHPLRYHPCTKEFLSFLPDGSFQLTQLKEPLPDAQT